MPGSLTRKVIAPALAFTLALGIFAFALAFTIPRRWWYMFGAAGTRAIGLIMTNPIAIRTRCSS